MSTNPNSYWNGNGRYQAIVDQLNKLVPMAGEVADPKTNKQLERFRKASKVYYDIFNNGGCNYARQVKPTFGIALRDYKRHGGFHQGRPYQKLDFDGLMVDLEEPMSQIILATAAEQLGKLPAAR